MPGEATPRAGLSGPATLNGSQFLDEAALYPHKGAVEREGVVHVGQEVGIGVRPDAAALKEALIPELHR